MTPQQAAMVTAMEIRFAESFEHRGYEDPQAEAKRWINELVRAGWRPWPALVDKAPPRRAAPSSVAQAAIAEARAVVDAKRGNRPELQAITEEPCVCDTGATCAADVHDKGRCDACERPGVYPLCCGDHQARMCSSCSNANHGGQQ